MNTIITIGREFGSGGREIGEKIAQHFKIPFYDKELLARAAKESGFCEEMIKNHDERPTNSFLYNLVMDTYSFGYNSSAYMDMPISHKVFLAQFDAIKKIADEGPCVIVGRCADFVLKDYDNVLSVFIHAPHEYCIQQAALKHSMSPKDLERYIIKTDKHRAEYYKYYTGREWTDARNYDLCLDSSKLGYDRCMQEIISYINVRFS